MIRWWIFANPMATLTRHIDTVTGDPPADLSQLRDITGIEEVSRTADQTVPLWTWITIAAVSLALLFIIWLWRRRWVRPRPVSPPDQWALEELNRVEEFTSAQDTDGFHRQLADVLRQYVRQRFDVRASQRTTREFLEALASSRLVSTEQQKLLGGILERCDLAKFARVHFSPDECRATVRMARDFVVSTRT